MPDYSRGCVYYIFSPQTDKIYIGSTTARLLSKRHNDHKNKYKLYLNGKFNYNTSFDIIKYGDTQIVLIEKYPCQSRNELECRELYWIEHEDYKDICVNKNKTYKKSTQKKVYKIYKLITSKTDKIYIGSTSKDKLEKRLDYHRQDYENYLNDKHEYITAFELFKLGIDDVNIELIEEFEDAKIVNIREQYYIDLYKDIVVNKTKAYVPEEEQRNNKLQNSKIYRQNLSDEKKKENNKKRREYRRNNPEKTKEQNKRYNKKRYTLYKEEIDKKNKEYVEKNKDKIYQQTMCECGETYAHKHCARHKRSQKHQNYLNNPFSIYPQI